MILSIESLSFRYAGSMKKALSDVSLEVASGEILFIVGGNGSGKTTLLSCIAGLMPDMIEGDLTGRFLLDGSEFIGTETSPPLGYVLQESEIYLFSRVEEEISFPLQNSGILPAEVKKRVREIATLLDIDNLLDREMASLSGGEQQKVAIATALTKDVPVLLLDEPFEQLDSDAAEVLLQLLKALAAAQGKIIIVAVRSFDYVSSYAHLLVLLRDGKIIHSNLAPIMPELLSLMPECINSFTTPVALRCREEIHDIPAGKKALLCIRGLEYKYLQGGGIENINLDLAYGEILAIMGPNGAGKTTLIKHIIGLLKAQQGTVVVMGQDSSKVPVSVNAKNIGILFQNPDDQIFNERIDKEIAWALKMRQRCSWEKAIADCQPLIEYLGLENIQKLHPHSMTRSCRQLVALASVMSSRPSLIILDEPGKSLDGNNLRRLMSNLISQFCNSSSSIIIVTHDPYLTWAYANRIALLVDGHLLATGTPEEILTNYQLTTKARISRHPFVQLLQKQYHAKTDPTEHF